MKRKKHTVEQIIKKLLGLPVIRRAEPAKMAGNSTLSQNDVKWQSSVAHVPNVTIKRLRASGIGLWAANSSGPSPSAACTAAVP